MSQNRAVLFVNGRMENAGAAAQLLRPDDLLVAVDGGLRFLRALDRWPGLLVGDLDSITSEEVAQAQAAGARLLRFPVEKDETDLELALKQVAAEGYTHICLLGALGGRLDQTLGNLSLLAHPDFAGLDVRITTPDTEVFLIRSRTEISGQKGDTLSLLPLFGPAEGVQTEGLYYPLRRETLLPYQTRGISNVMLGERAVVSLEAGLLLCAHLRPSALDQ